MGKIRNYELLEDFKGDEIFVVETDNGTKSLSVGAIKAYITTAVEEKSDMLNQNEVKIVSDTDSEYVLNISVGATTITTPNLKGKSIKSMEIVSGHLIIYFTDETSVDLGVIGGVIPVYGVCRDINSHSPELKRVGDAEGLVAEVGVLDETVRNDFDNIYPWSEIKRCTLADDGTVTSYQGDPNYKEDGSMGNVMVEIPKFYIAHYLNESKTKEYWYISKEQVNSRYRLAQPFIGKNGTQLDKIYIAAYASTILGDAFDSCSRGDTYVEQYPDKDTFKAHKFKAENWHFTDISEWSDVIQSLFIVEFATLNSLSVMTAFTGINLSETVYTASSESTPQTEIIGNTFWYTPLNMQIEKGQEIRIETDAEYLTEPEDDVEYNNAVRTVTDILANADGSVAVTFSGSAVKIKNNETQISYSYRNGVANSIKASSGVTSHTVNHGLLKYRGFENLYGFHSTLIDGIMAYRTDEAQTDIINYYYRNNIENHSWQLVDYTKLAFNAPLNTGYISQMGIDENFPYILMPINSDGQSDEDFCDVFKPMNNRTKNPCYAVSEDGLFHYNFWYSTSLNSFYPNVRIAYRRYVQED